jgi:formate-nitrite transporter family protein
VSSEDTMRSEFASDAQAVATASESTSPLKPSRQMLDQEMMQAAEEFERPIYGLLLSGFSAGLGVGVSFFLIATIATYSGGGGIPRLATEFLMANAFSVGFIIVILGRMDLFTEFTTIAILPVLAKRASFAALAKLWVFVYVGNIAGAITFAAIAVALGGQLGTLSERAVAQIADQLVPRERNNRAWSSFAVSFAKHVVIATEPCQCRSSYKVLPSLR